MPAIVPARSVARHAQDPAEAERTLAAESVRRYALTSQEVFRASSGSRRMLLLFDRHQPVELGAYVAHTTSNNHPAVGAPRLRAAAKPYRAAGAWCSEVRARAIGRWRWSFGARRPASSQPSSAHEALKSRRLRASNGRFAARQQPAVDHQQGCTPSARVEQDSHVKLQK